MKDLLCDEFQDAVGRCLIRHRSILDIVSKLQEATARVNRAAIKSATTCGCITIEASKPQIPPDITLEELPNYIGTSVEGALCESCRETLEDELGKLWFYTAGLCNALELNMFDTLIKEYKKLSALGVFSMH